MPFDEREHLEDAIFLTGYINTKYMVIMMSKDAGKQSRATRLSFSERNYPFHERSSGAGAYLKRWVGGKNDQKWKPTLYIALKKEEAAALKTAARRRNFWFRITDLCVCSFFMARVQENSPF